MMALSEKTVRHEIYYQLAQQKLVMMMFVVYPAVAMLIKNRRGLLFKRVMNFI
ncbi:hypothetical protein [Hafnia psychrotolerans]|jgi:hypothetical protein|uniref:hypothetical protein n=1 Tax=Hafnia psychrotolerans TaxID=1477018 RepID=UPI001662EDBF|nr:hypothetical protein [Hafnia psychrotolerans]